MRYECDEKVKLDTKFVSSYQLYGAILQIHRALWGIYRAVSRIYRALLLKYMGLISNTNVTKESNSIHGCRWTQILWVIRRVLSQIYRALLKIYRALSQYQCDEKVKLDT